MATNKSEHLQLNLWEPEDSVLREEFNENWEKIDDAAERLESELAAGLEEVKASQPVQHLATGSYKGNGGTQSISLGFTPKLVFVHSYLASESAGRRSALAMQGLSSYTGSSQTIQAVSISENGFTVVFDSANTLGVNISGSTYYYCAIG